MQGKTQAGMRSQFQGPELLIRSLYPVRASDEKGIAGGPDHIHQ